MRKLLAIFLTIFMAVSVFAAAPTAGSVLVVPIYDNGGTNYTAADFSITTGFTIGPDDNPITDCYYTLNDGTDWDAGVWTVGDTNSCTENITGKTDGTPLIVNMKATNGEETEATAVAVTVDDTTPVTTPLFTSTDWQTADIAITLACDDTTGSGCAQTLYCIDSVNTCTPATAYTSELTHSTEGTNYIRFNSTDNVGNAESVLIQVLKLDKAGPTYSNIVPANNSYATSLTVSFDVSDAGIGVDQSTIALYLDTVQEAGFDSATCTGTSEMYSCGYTFISLTETSHTLTISASDLMAGPNATETTVTFTYDVSNPSVSDYDPNNGDTDVLINENVSVTFDEGMNTSSVQNAFTMYETATPANTVSGDFSWSGNTLTFNPTNLLAEEIEYTIEIANTATDLAGNPLNENPFTFSFTTVADNDKPETNSSYSSTNWQKSNISITLTCSDNGGSGCKETKYCIDSGNSCTPGTTYSGAISHSTEGTRYIRYRSEDYSGNVEDTKSQILKLDKQNPNTPTLDKAESRNEEVYLDWGSVSDNGDSGIKHYKIYKNGSEIGTTTDTEYFADGLSNGTEYNFKIRAVDNAENESSYSNEKSATPTAGSDDDPEEDTCGDTTEPTLEWVSPKDGQKFKKGTIELKVSASDNGTMESVRFYSEKKYIGSITSPSSGNNWIYEWDASEKELGDYPIRTMARDTCGNATNKEITITLTDEEIVDDTIVLENADSNGEAPATTDIEPSARTTAVAETDTTTTDETSAGEAPSALTMFANLLGSEYIMLGLGLLILAAVALFVVNYMRSGQGESDNGFSDSFGLGAAYRKADRGGFGPSSRSRQSEFLSDLAGKIRNEKPAEKNPRWAYKK